MTPWPDSEGNCVRVHDPPRQTSANGWPFPPPVSSNVPTAHTCEVPGTRATAVKSVSAAFPAPGFGADTTDQVWPTRWRVIGTRNPELDIRPPTAHASVGETLVTPFSVEPFGRDETRESCQSLPFQCRRNG